YIMQRIFFLFSVLFLTFTSCKSLQQIQKETELFQPKLDTTTRIVYKELKIQPFDRIRIQLNTEATSEQEQTAIFNLPGNSGVVSIGGIGNIPGGMPSTNYQVDYQGFIQYPKLGKLQVAGLTSTQLKDSLTKLLSVYVKSPRVFVQIAEVPICAFGQIARTGRLTFGDERVNLYDFLSVSGGNVLQGGRLDNILVVREDSGRRKYYEVDISNPVSVYQSPVFQLQQNDVVYVRQNKNRLRQLRNNEFGTSLQLGTTGINLFTTFANLFFLIYTLAR
ncbi:MAG: polysaccharide biosynthesis/export family protein, partial [Chitinophagaceae bacterium]